ncbi:hypothetical protein GGI17_004720 [Coemansia sp. S146]|nr:hypothetical protein GGI17_004720 [Coemansia sp. S146]
MMTIWSTCYNDETKHVNTSTDLLSFALCIRPGAPMQKIDNLESDDPAWTFVLPHLCIFDFIQVLVLPKICLALWDGILLLKAFPLLSDLHNSMPFLGEIPAGINLAKLPAHAIYNHASMGIKSP